MAPRDDERRKFEAWAEKTWLTDSANKPNLRGVSNQWTGEWAYTYSETAHLFMAWLARAEQAETPRTRQELEKEWLAQTEWQDFTNWLIHVKLGYVSVENCPSPSYTVCGAAMQPKVEFKCLSCGSTPAPTEPVIALWFKACSENEPGAIKAVWQPKVAAQVEDRPAPTPRPFGASFEDTGTVPHVAPTPEDK